MCTEDESESQAEDKWVRTFKCKFRQLALANPSSRQVLPESILETISASGVFRMRKEKTCDRPYSAGAIFKRADYETGSGDAILDQFNCKIFMHANLMPSYHIQSMRPYTV